MTHHPRPYRVLFLCTGNSARSVFAEYFLRRLGHGRFEVHSAGANPSATVNPLTLKVLREKFHIDASEARSKSWEEFKGMNFDFVITVCDNARETCPIWPGQPIVAHWGSEDPDQAGASEEETRRVFRRVAGEIYRRIELFCALPIDKLDRLRLEKMTKAIGRGEVSVREEATERSR